MQWKKNVLRSAGISPCLAARRPHHYQTPLALIQGRRIGTIDKQAAAFALRASSRSDHQPASAASTDSWKGIVAIVSLAGGAARHLQQNRCSVLCCAVLLDSRCDDSENSDRPWWPPWREAWLTIRYLKPRDDRATCPPDEHHHHVENAAVSHASHGCVAFSVAFHGPSCASAILHDCVPVPHHPDLLAPGGSLESPQQWADGPPQTPHCCATAKVPRCVSQSHSSRLAPIYAVCGEALD
ncbi:hypothetical protein P154DRAFT_310338 [Amniculicola lignicola CBS 123094]|uniref:Uncharacterized protein n=1 Tax=Amniculicola lignicola CBS 123094 TaxID=1392246 RepID=A0A6A5W5C9_9PLEO|nr:hypothetical protein P154DRAFT_310338 [Amniculicola lignicola CBS 123094]